MSKLDDLHTLERLLNEFGFPVSPILAYAIKEKEEELRAECQYSVTEETVEESKVAEFIDEPSFDSVKEEFSYYLHKMKSLHTAKNYLYMIDKPIRDFIKINIDSTADSIYSFKTSEEVMNVKLKLLEDMSFVEKNMRTHNALTAAISSYYKFLEAKEKNN